MGLCRYLTRRWEDHVRKIISPFGPYAIGGGSRDFLSHHHPHHRHAFTRSPWASHWGWGSSSSASSSGTSKRGRRRWGMAWSWGGFRGGPRAFHRHHGWYPYGRGPSRFLWFVIGGASVMWWMSRKEERFKESGWCSRVHRSVKSDKEKESEREARLKAAAAAEQSRENIKSRGSMGPRQLESLKWEHERERLAALSNQTAESMADMSEATLNSVLSTVEQLKVKLAQHHADREAFLREQAEREARQRSRAQSPSKDSSTSSGSGFSVV